MFTTRLTNRIAAAALAAALTLVGLVGVGTPDIDDHYGDAPTEEAAATWSFTSPKAGNDWSDTQGATWS